MALIVDEWQFMTNLATVSKKIKLIIPNLKNHFLHKFRYASLHEYLHMKFSRSVLFFDG